MKASIFIATSLDGFIARENGDIDWLDGADGEDYGSNGEDYGFYEFLNSIDAIVMGRNSFEVVLKLDEWLYKDKPMFVLSNRELKIPAHLIDKVNQMSGSPGEVAGQLAEQGFEHLYVDGGKTIQSFLESGLINRITITRIPVLLGKGIPLFGTLAHDIHLKHIETRPYPVGLVQSTYEVLG